MIRDGVTPRLAPYPGREAILPRVQVEPIVETLARAIEELSWEYTGDFHPHDPIVDSVLYEALEKVAELSRMSMRFDRWTYVLEVYMDMGRIDVELYAVRTAVPVRICLFDFHVEAHPTDCTVDGYGVTPAEFIKELRERLLDANERAAKWNEICERHRPYFERVSPANIADAIKLNLRDREAIVAEDGILETWELFAEISQTNPIKSGPWEIWFEFCESVDYVWLRTLMRNLHLDDFTFVLHSTDAVFGVSILESSNIPYMIDMFSERSAAGIIAWNKMLDGPGR